MKNTKNKFLALILIATVAFFCCKKADPIAARPQTNAGSTTPNNNPTLTRGDWMVGLFQENGVDKTNHFRGYLFKFNSNGAINVSKDSTSVNGNWSTGQDDAQNKFIINFSSVPLSELNDDWHIMGETFNDLKLERPSANDSSADYLTFRRNQQE
ncbi:MAG: hypothetical protein H7141_09455 [Burkholderiales bacterium]|nr:hypothetical protein [Bacteroidia bacterium]